MNPKAEKNLRFQHLAFVNSLALVEYYWKCSTGNKKVLSYAAALRQLAVEKLSVEKLKTAGRSPGNPAAVCELCGELVAQRKGFMDRRYGILENCNHVFCLSCIRTYRQLAFVQKQADEKGRKSCSEEPLPAPVSCPICGAESDLVASSDTWIAGQDAKRTHLLLFRKEMSSMPCPWFKCGLGKCMFPDRCVAKQE